MRQVAVQQQGSAKSRSPFLAASAKFNLTQGSKLSGPSHGSSRSIKRHGLRAFKPRLALHLVHRLAILAAAVFYALTSVQSSLSILDSLSGVQQPTLLTKTYNAKLMQQYIGNGSICSSPLVQEVLANDTTPRNNTFYIEANGSSTDACHTPKYNSKMYSNSFLRSIYVNLAQGTNHTYTVLQHLQLIAPVVDCSMTLITGGDKTRHQYYLLLRNSSNANDVYVCSMRLSVQDYSIQAQVESGPSALIAFALFNSSKATNLTHRFAGSLGYPYIKLALEPYTLLSNSNDGQLEFKSVSMNATIKTSKRIMTTRRTGFYVKSISDRSNLKRWYWVFDKTPAKDVSRWFANGLSVLRNSWAWVHGVHFIFALDLAFNLGVLLIIVVRGLLKRKIWIGDAFVSISTTLVVRGGAIVLGWWIEDFWTLDEFCMYLANQLGGVQQVPIYLDLMHADLMTLYLCAAMALGYVIQEKIDPALTMISFEMAWRNALPLVKWFPSVTTKLAAFAVADFNAGSMVMSAQMAKTAAMRYWTLHEMPTSIIQYRFQTIQPVLLALVVPTAYGLLRKIYRHFYPDRFSTARSSHRTSTTESSMREGGLVSQQRRLTMFEISTGAPLESRVGLVAEYEHCRMIKGMKFASPDGIYSSGFVIVNGRFLVASVDLFSILVMKLTRWRFTNIRVFEVSGSTVKETARLVYPETIAWGDLINVSLSVLS